MELGSGGSGGGGGGAGRGGRFAAKRKGAPEAAAPRRLWILPALWKRRAALRVGGARGGAGRGVTSNVSARQSSERHSFCRPSAASYIPVPPTDRLLLFCMRQAVSRGWPPLPAVRSEKLLHSESKKSIGGGAAARLDQRRRRPGQTRAYYYR